MRGKLIGQDYLDTMRRALLCLPLLLLGLNVQAQIDSCQEKLIEASQLYDKGKLSQVIQTLGNCLYDHDESRVTRRNALNMAAETFVFMDSLGLARRVLLELLRLDPFYQINRDIPEMRYLREQVVTYPAMEFTVFFGPNLLTRTSFESAQVFSGATLLSRKFSLKGLDGEYDASWGFRGGMDLGFALGKNSNFNLHLGGNISRNAFRYIQEMDNVPNFENVSGRANLFVAEKHFWLQVPVFLTYNLIPRESIVRRHWIPFLKFGASYDFMIRETAKLSSLRLNFPPDRASFVRSGMRIGAYRNASNFSLQAGAGLKLHLHRFFLLFEAQYNQSLRNLRNPTTERLLIDEYRYVDNDFKVSNLNTRIGLGLFLFKAKVK